MTLSKSDVFRSEIITAPELESDGYGVNSIYLSAVISTTSATNTVTIVLPPDDVSLKWSQDYQVDAKDIIWIFGTNPSGIADGYYTINQVLDDTSFTINETLPDSTDGYIQFRFPAGANLVGVNSTGMVDVQSNTVQEAIQELDFNKLNATQHDGLRQLIHFIDCGPTNGFGSSFFSETIGFPFISSETWYVDNSKTQKIYEVLIDRWGGVMPKSITYNLYSSDGITILHSINDLITYYNNVFEKSRDRTVIK